MQGEGPSREACGQRGCRPRQTGRRGTVAGKGKRQEEREKSTSCRCAWCRCCVAALAHFSDAVGRDGTLTGQSQAGRTVSAPAWGREREGEQPEPRHRKSVAALPARCSAYVGGACADHQTDGICAQLGLRPSYKRPPRPGKPQTRRSATFCQVRPNPGGQSGPTQIIRRSHGQHMAGDSENRRSRAWTRTHNYHAAPLSLPRSPGAVSVTLFLSLSLSQPSEMGSPGPLGSGAKRAKAIAIE